MNPHALRLVPPPPPPSEHPLWTLTKAGHQAEARVRTTPFGPELRILLDDELWWSQVFIPPTEDAMTAAADQKRAEFEALGWATSHLTEDRPMFEPINHYYRLEYATHDAATAAEYAFLHFVESQFGLAHLALTGGNERVVLWNESVAPDNRVQFVSAGGLKLLQALDAAIPLATRMPTPHLPPTRQLLVGDAKDWDHTGPY